MTRPPRIPRPKAKPYDRTLAARRLTAHLATRDAHHRAWAAIWVAIAAGMGVGSTLLSPRLGGAVALFYAVSAWVAWRRR